MTDALATIDNRAVVPSNPLAGLSREDIAFPRLNLQQKTSDKVDKGLCKPGEIIDSNTGEILAVESSKLEIIPLTVSKSWFEYEMQDFDKKYTGMREIKTATDDALPYEEVTPEGVIIKREKAMNWMVLVVKTLGAGFGMPYLLTFKSSSYRTGKQLAGLVATRAFFNKPMHSMTYELSSFKRTKDKNSFFTFEIGKGRDTIEDEAAIAEKWLPVLNKPVEFEDPTF